MLALVIDQYSVNTNLDWSYHLLSQSVLWPSCQLLLLGPFYKSLSRSLSLSSTLSDYHKLSVSLLCQLDVRSIWQIKSCRCSKLTWSVELRIMYDPGISIPKINDVQSSGFVFSDARSWFCRVLPSRSTSESLGSSDSVPCFMLFVSMNKRVAQHLRNPASAGPHQGLSYKEGGRETHHWNLVTVSVRDKLREKSHERWGWNIKMMGANRVPLRKTVWRRDNEKT